MFYIYKFGECKMKRLLLSVVSLVVTAGSTFNVMAAAPQIDKMQYKGESVYTYFSEYIPHMSYCGVYLYGNVWAAKNVTHDVPGAPVKSNEGNVGLWFYDSCYWWSYYGGNAYIQDLSFNIRSPKEATLSGYADIDLGYYGTVRVALDLSFVGTGDVYRGMYTERSQYGNTTYRYRSNGSSSEASVTGSLMMDGTNLIANPDSISSSISDSKSGWMEISRY